MRLETKYTNGNYDVLIFDNGTKVRLLKNPKETEYKAELPESIDCCISHRCSIGCKYCYADCKPEGEDISLDHPTVIRFLNNLPSGAELAIGGGALSDIPVPKLMRFLRMIRDMDCFANITVNIKELVKHPGFKRCLYRNSLFGRYIYGIGISYGSSNIEKEIMLELRDRAKNVVIHTIAGVTSPEDYKWLAENDFKVLVLGYKNKGRGALNIKETLNHEYMDWLKNNILSLNISTLSFDCLAVEQLEIQKQVSSDVWEKYYMGNDGQFTMYVDLVDLTYAKSSTEPKENHFDMERFDIETMFRHVKSLNNK